MSLPERRYTAMLAFPYTQVPLRPNPSFITTSEGGGIGGAIQAAHAGSVSYIQNSKAEQSRPQQAACKEPMIYELLIFPQCKAGGKTIYHLWETKLLSLCLTS